MGHCNGCMVLLSDLEKWTSFLSFHMDIPTCSPYCHGDFCGQLTQNDHKAYNHSRKAREQSRNDVELQRLG